MFVWSNKLYIAKTAPLCTYNKLDTFANLEHCVEWYREFLTLFAEEMISSNNVMYFSPNGSYLAFAKFNDSLCQRINFERYDGGIYPDMQVVSYPKVIRRDSNSYAVSSRLENRGIYWISTKTHNVKLFFHTRSNVWNKLHTPILIEIYANCYGRIVDSVYTWRQFRIFRGATRKQNLRRSCDMSQWELVNLSNFQSLEMCESTIRFTVVPFTANARVDIGENYDVRYQWRVLV